MSQEIPMCFKVWDAEWWGPGDDSKRQDGFMAAAAELHGAGCGQSEGSWQSALDS